MEKLENKIRVIAMEIKGGKTPELVEILYYEIMEYINSSELNFEPEVEDYLDDMLFNSISLLDEICNDEEVYDNTSSREISDIGLILVHYYQCERLAK